MEHLATRVGCWQIDELDLSLHSVYLLIVKLSQLTMALYDPASQTISGNLSCRAKLYPRSLPLLYRK